MSWAKRNRRRKTIPDRGNKAWGRTERGFWVFFFPFFVRAQRERVKKQKDERRR